MRKVKTFNTESAEEEKPSDGVVGTFLGRGAACCARLPYQFPNYKLRECRGQQQRVFFGGCVVARAAAYHFKFMARVEMQRGEV